MTGKMRILGGSLLPTILLASLLSACTSSDAGLPGSHARNAAADTKHARADALAGFARQLRNREAETLQAPKPRSTGSVSSRSNAMRRPSAAPDTAMLLASRPLARPEGLFIRASAPAQPRVEPLVRQAVARPQLEVEPPQRIGKGPLASFHRKLAALEAGTRTEPVTILHIGDSHVASDSFSRGIRNALQTRYGDAGRGAVIPAGSFKYGVADQLELTTSGKWRARTALKSKTGRFGVSGVEVSSSSTAATMRMTKKNGPFDWAEVTVATGPDQGKLKLTVGGRERVFDARASKAGAETFRLDARGTTLIVSPAGGGRTTVLNWATGKNRPGIRYVNFGLIGATLSITDRFDPALLEHDLKNIKPDLIVYGYGTNEGFNDNLDTKRYRRKADKYVSQLQEWAGGADVVYLGAASGLRKGRKGGVRCGGWSAPRRLETLRQSVEVLAETSDAAYWDWADAMGGPCAINDWAQNGLAARDRVHLTMSGYRRSASAFADWLTRPVANTARTFASN